MDWRHPLCALDAWWGRRRPPGPPSAEALARHAAADAAGKDHYVDPDSGRRVHTAGALRALGACCGLGCRHCPFPAP